MSDYFTVLTNAGADAVASAATGELLKVTHMAVGSGRMDSSIPTADEMKAYSSLANEVDRVAINAAGKGAEPGTYYLQGIVPVDRGGYWIKEVGWYLDDGTLFAVTNYPPTEKTTPNSGAGIEIPIKAYIKVSNDVSVTVVVDDSQTYATISYVNTKVSEVSESLNRRTHGRNIAVDLSDQVQLSSYRKSVIALCKLVNTSSNYESWNFGELSFTRVNGIVPNIIAQVAVSRRYMTEKMRGSLQTNGCRFTPRLCTFKINGTRYGGVEFYHSAPENDVVTYNGTGSFVPFGLDYYDIRSNLALNQEVADTINFESTIEIDDEIAFNGASLLTDKRFCDDDDVVTGGRTDLIVSPKAAAAGDNQVRQEMAIHGVGNRMSLQSGYFITRSFDITMNLNSPCEFPDLPSDASDILVFGTTQGTGSDSNLVARFHKSNGEWNATHIYTYDLFSNRPSVKIINGKPHFTCFHASNYVYSFYCQIALQGTGSARPFDFFANIYSTQNKPTPPEIGAISDIGRYIGGVDANDLTERTECVLALNNVQNLPSVAPYIIEVIVVKTQNSSEKRIVQKAHLYHGEPKSYIRYRVGEGQWSEWDLVFTSNNKPSAADVKGGTFPDEVFSPQSRSWNCRLASTANAVGLNVWSHTQQQLVGGVGIYSNNGTEHGNAFVYLGFGDSPWNRADGVRISRIEFTYFGKTVYHAGNIETVLKQEHRSTETDQALAPHEKRYLTSEGPFTLPSTAGMSAGTTIALNKCHGIWPMIKTSDVDIKLSKRNGRAVQTGSEFMYKANREVLVAFNGEHWEVQ